MFKYLIFGNPQDVPQIVIFDSITDHSTIRRAFEHKTLISAGKMSENWNCYNGSVTLGIPSTIKRSLEDTAIMKKMRELN